MFLLICIYYFGLLLTRAQKLRAVIKLFANLLSLIYEMSVVRRCARTELTALGFLSEVRLNWSQDDALVDSIPRTTCSNDDEWINIIISSLSSPPILLLKRGEGKDPH